MSGPRHAPPFALSGGVLAAALLVLAPGAGRAGRIRTDSGPRLRRARLAVERRRLAGPAGRARPRADQARPRPSLQQQRQCAAHRHAAVAAHRQRQGPGAQAVGGGGDAGVERRGAAGRAAGAFRRPGALLSRRRPRPAPVSVRAALFHPDAEGGVDDLAARPSGAPRLPHRPAFRARHAVVVRRVDRPLRERRHARRRHHRPLDRQELHRQFPHAAHRQAARRRALHHRARRQVPDARSRPSRTPTPSTSR